MSPHPDPDCVGLDEERKKELLMEKKLRACRVNILPRNGGYLSEPCTPAPVKKKQDPISPSPAAVEKATNPIALRYWNQCMDTNSQVTSPVMERRNQNVDVVKILSTAGTGIKRENEVKEALGNINRFYTVVIQPLYSQHEVPCAVYSGQCCPGLA